MRGDRAGGQGSNAAIVLSINAPWLNRADFGLQERGYKASVRNTTQKQKLHASLRNTDNPISSENTDSGGGC